MPRKFVCALFLLISSAVPAQSSRHFTFHYAFTVKNVPEAQKIRIWFPAAHSDDFQDIKVASAKGDLPLKRTKESRFGNEIYYAETSKSQSGDLHFAVDYDVVRRERLTLGMSRPRLQDATLTKKEQQQNLAPDKLVPITGLPAELAIKVTTGKSSTLDKAPPFTITCSTTCAMTKPEAAGAGVTCSTPVMQKRATAPTSIPSSSP